jgi:dihydrofolate synthase / folylpolyglutamate synthase
MTDPAAGLSYGQALAALAERGRFGIRLGLGRTRALLRELGHPERTIRGALIAGTNGKGSVLALADSALRAAGYHVGSTPKPHLVSYRERVAVDGRPIDADDFARLVGRVLVAADRVASRHGEPTEFELLTAVVFAHFAEVRPDVALVEVGLGGRLDATHAWDGGVAIVTNVDLDHMDRLGDTIAAIAREKAAIIERGDRAVTGALGDGLAVVRRRARRLGVPLTEVDAPPILGWDRDGLDVDLPRLGATRVGLRGRHQAINAAIADATLDALDAAGIASVSASARRAGYATATWPGRLELLRVDDHDVLLDGAHNPAGAAALAIALDDLRPYLDRGPVTLVTASMVDKDVDGVIAALGQSTALADATVIATSPYVARAMPAQELAARWSAASAAERTSGARTVVAEPDAIAALGRALRGPGPVLVAGSLYLVGAARGHLVDDPDLRDPAPIEVA